jgi:hypothetical protein
MPRALRTLVPTSYATCSDSCYRWSSSSPRGGTIGWAGWATTHPNGSSTVACTVASLQCIAWALPARVAHLEIAKTKIKVDCIDSIVVLYKPVVTCVYIGSMT